MFCKRARQEFDRIYYNCIVGTTVFRKKKVKKEAFSVFAVERAPNKHQTRLKCFVCLFVCLFSCGPGFSLTWYFSNHVITRKKKECFSFLIALKEVEKLKTIFLQGDRLCKLRNLCNTPFARINPLKFKYRSEHFITCLKS